MKSTPLVPAGLILMAVLACVSTSHADIVAYWSFDEGSGDAAEDGSGNGNDGNIFGAEWVDGKFRSIIQEPTLAMSLVTGTISHLCATVLRRRYIPTWMVS